MSAARPHRALHAIAATAFSLAGLAWAPAAHAQATAQAGLDAPPGASIPAEPPLRYFSTAGTSVAVTFSLGDRFSGPGIVNVGRLGARKQLALPAGEWVALAAVDHDSMGGRLEFTTLRFGKFVGRRLQSMLSFTVNRTATEVTRWTDIEQCAADTAGTLLHAATLPSATRSECMAVHAWPGIKLAEQRGGEEALASLERLGASHGGPALSSTWYFAERKHGYMRVSRIDWLHAVYGHDSGNAAAWQPAALPASAERQAHARALLWWVEGYRLLAAHGFRRGMDLEALQPGQPAGSGDGSSLLVDVAWPERRAAQ